MHNDSQTDRYKMTASDRQGSDKEINLGDSTRLVILEKMVSGAPLDDLLARLARHVEQEAPGAYCAFLLTDSSGTLLLYGAAPSLQKIYNNDMPPVKITRSGDACVTAAFLHKRVIVEDVQSQSSGSMPESCRQKGFMSYWAEPIISAGGELQGIFLLHYREPHTPDPQELELVQSMTRLACIAIERVKTEEKQRKLEEQLRHMQKIEAIGQLTGGIAHDFNNMLTPIFVYAEMIKRTLADDDPSLKKMECLIASASKAKEITQKLLSFSRKQTLCKTVLDLNEVVSTFKELLQRTIRENVAISFTPSSTPALTLADRGQLEQVLLNLAVNAQDAIADKGEISIRTGHVLLDDEYARLHPGMKPGDHVVMVFSDTGCGINDEIMEHLFEPFFTTKSIGQGTGLGLATIYGIVKQHEGYIKVTSQLGIGSTFTLYLPEYRGEQKPVKPPKTAEIQQTKRAQETTILVVDDNSMLLEMAVELLESAGYNTLAASDPVKALQIADSADAAIDLLVSDVVMPEMSGPELYEQLTRKHTSLPVLFISGYTSDIQLSKDALNDAINFLPKPFTSEQLLTNIQQLVK